MKFTLLRWFEYLVPVLAFFMSESLAGAGQESKAPVQRRPASVVEAPVYASRPDVKSNLRLPQGQVEKAVKTGVKQPSWLSPNLERVARIPGGSLAEWTPMRMPWSLR